MEGHCFVGPASLRMTTLSVEGCVGDICSWRAQTPISHSPHHTAHPTLCNPLRRKHIYSADLTTPTPITHLTLQKDPPCSPSPCLPAGPPPSFFAAGGRPGRGQGPHPCALCSDPDRHSHIHGAGGAGAQARCRDNDMITPICCG